MTLSFGVPAGDRIEGALMKSADCARISAANVLPHFDHQI